MFAEVGVVFEVLLHIEADIVNAGNGAIPEHRLVLVGKQSLPWLALLITHQVQAQYWVAVPVEHLGKVVFGATVIFVAVND